MKFFTVSDATKLGRMQPDKDSFPLNMNTIAADTASGRTADCQCAKCRVKRRSALTIADLEKTIVGPKGRPPRTIAEMNEYARQFYAK